MMAELPKIVHILGGYILTILTKEIELDEEWLDLIIEARNLGISIDEIRDFLQSS